MSSRIGAAMRYRLHSDRLVWVALALTIAAKAAAQEPREWLERMNEALTTRNYDGVFQHWQGRRVETLRIIHRVVDGKVTERLVSLDGSGREFIRTGTELVCYLPDKKTVLVERRPQEGPLLGNLPSFDQNTTEFYDISELRRERLNRRATRVIAVTPKDEFRYGYRLWIDEATGMPLKTQLCDSRGRAIETLVFASLTLPSAIPDSMFEPEVSTEGFRWLRNETGKDLISTPMLWSALKLPPGFRMSARSSQMMPGSSDPVEHLVFTDGLASVSVFVERRSSEEKQDAQASSPQQRVIGALRVGASSAFSTFVDGHKVTAVGEVPPRTVQFIANSVKAEAPAIAPPRR
ncbi:MAG: MucB/RseB C-terminal domain-containing protein [Pseudomonadota bacterium]